MDPTQRFSSRVEDYRRYRPGYPSQLVDNLLATLPKTATIADIGSGTGLLARLFLERGHRVIGIEPNPEMRGSAGDQELRQFPNFQSLPATAEATTLPPHSIDLITAAQAFHWFDREKTKHEFHRILRPDGEDRGGGGSGTCALIWNDRQTTTPFLIAYEKLLHDFATDYAKVDHKQITDEILAAFFSPHEITTRIYPNHQLFDFEGLKGRLLSSSYAPHSTHPDHTPMLTRLAKIFDQHSQNGQISFDYETKVYTGKLS